MNCKEPHILYLDLNSCFATIEQQANPLLRGKPVVVAAYTTPSGCILAPSIEAKRLGITLGMHVCEARALCPSVVVLPPDPQKYRFVNRKLTQLLSSYTPKLSVKSIDEMVLDLSNTPSRKKGMLAIAADIKQRIRAEIGDCIKVSIGIATNRWLSKTAASFKKPDGLTVITHKNVREILGTLSLSDLCGIKTGNRARLNSMGIFTPLEFLDADILTLKRAFHSIVGYYWHLRLRGWEADSIEFGRKTYGQSYALPRVTADTKILHKLLCKLVEKMGRRLRQGEHAARGVTLGCLFRDGTSFSKSRNFHEVLFTSNDLYVRALNLLYSCPRKLVSNLRVSCFDLIPNPLRQMSLFERENKRRSLAQAIDDVNERFGEFTLTPALMMGMEDTILDRIAFGR